MEKRTRGTKMEGAGAGTAGGGNVRARLLAAATELFADRGYAPTTVREIVKKAGVTKPVLYYYFRNKEGLYLDLMRDTFRTVFSAIEETISEKGTARERLFRLCFRCYDVYLENLSVARAMYSIYYGPPQGAPFFDFEGFHLQVQRVFRQIVEEGILGGEFRDADPEDVTWAVLGVVTVGTEQELCRHSGRLGRDGIRRVLEVILNGIENVEKCEKGKAGK